MDGLKNYYYDPEGKTLTIWYDDPSKEFLTEEISEEIALIKDQTGKVIGLEHLSYSSPKRIVDAVYLTDSFVNPFPIAS